MESNFIYLVGISIYILIILLVPHYWLRSIRINSQNKNTYSSQILNDNITLRITFTDNQRQQWASEYLPKWYKPLANTVYFVNKDLGDCISSTKFNGNFDFVMDSNGAAVKFQSILDKQFKVEYFKASFKLPRNWARAAITWLILISILVSVIVTNELKEFYIIMLTFVVGFYLGTTSFKRGEIDDVFCVTIQKFRDFHDKLVTSTAKFLFIVPILIVIFWIMGIVGDTNEYFNELGKFIAGIGTFCIILFYMVHRTKPSRGEYGSNIVNLTKTRTGIGILLIITTIILFFSELTPSDVFYYDFLKNIQLYLSTFVNILITAYFGTAKK